MTQPPRDGWPAGYDDRAREAGRASWDAWVAEVEAARGFSICGRKTGRRNKAPGSPCPNREGRGTGKGYGACRSHGGNSPAGAAAPQWKHGGLSRAPAVLGRTLRDRLDEALRTDPREMMQLGASVLVARFHELVERIDAGAGGTQTIGRARELLSEMRTATDGAQLAKLLHELENVLGRAGASEETWAELYRVVGMMGTHAERTRRFMEAAGEYIERARAVALLDRFGDDVARAIMEETSIPEESRIALRRKIAGIVMAYLNQRQLPQPAA